MEILKVDKLCKTYGTGDARVEALKAVSLTLEKGEFAAVVGESGSGKSTLLNLVGGLDTPNAGKVFLDGKRSVCHERKGTDGFQKEEHRIYFFRAFISFRSLRWSRIWSFLFCWTIRSLTWTMWRNCWGAWG